MTTPEPTRKIDPQALIHLVGQHGHNGFLGLRYIGHGDDWGELALDYDARFTSDAASGILASGPILTLMDLATSFAIWVRTDGFTPQATLDLRIDYLRAAIPGRTVIGHGECYRITRRVAFVRGYAHDGNADDPVAHVAGTFMFTDA